MLKAHKLLTRPLSIFSLCLKLFTFTVFSKKVICSLSVIKVKFSENVVITQAYKNDPKVVKVELLIFKKKYNDSYQGVFNAQGMTPAADPLQ